MKHFLYAAIILTSLILPSAAQSTRATVSGTVYDSSGAAIPNAKVTIVNLERNTRDTRMANAVGRYMLSDLAPGSYELEASAPGFKVKRTTGIALDGGQQLEVNPALEVGQTGESVTVSASSVELETANAVVSGVVGSEQVKDLPLNARDFYSLLQLVPNVRAGVPGVSSAQVPSINGGRSWGVEASVDGAPATALGANPAPGAASPAYITGLDNVAQFRVLTNTLPAEYGNTYSGYISLVTKSGNNTFHGSMFDYMRNSALDSNNFFNNRAGLPLGSFKRHQFGTTLGGPIVRNKTFFFLYYDGLRSSSSVSTVSSVPTSLQRNGDFSQTFNGTGQLVTMYDPQTTQTNAAGTASVRTPFPGNMIPQGRFDPVAVRMLSLLPVATTSGNNFTHANNLVTAASNGSNQDKYDARIDHRFNDRHSLFVRGSYTNSDSKIAAPLGPLDNNVARRQPVWNGALDYTWIKSSSSVVNVHYAYNRVEAVNNPMGQEVPDYKSLGFSSGFAAAIAPIYQYMPQMNINAMTIWGPANSSIVVPVNHQMSGSLSKVRDHHSFKFGVDARLLTSQIAPAQAPQFSFGTNYTQGPNPVIASATAGYGFASFLIGAGSGNLTSNPPVQVSAPIAAFYVQDDWKVSRRLTINLGLRYDLFFPRTEAEDRLNYFDATMVSPLAGPSKLPILGGLRFVNQAGAASTQVPLDKNNFSPRIGLAYSIDAKTVLRTGFGILYPPQSYGINVSNAGFQGFDALTQWVSDANSLQLSSPLSAAFQTGLLEPSNGSRGALTNVGQAISTASPQHSRISTYSEQWNFGVQRMLLSSTMLEVNYLGNHGLHLPLQPGYQLNTLSPEQMTLGAGLTRLVPNPFYGLITSGGLTGVNTTVGQLMRPYPQYTGVNILFDPAATSHYHALGVRLQSRLRKNYILSLAYTRGKQIDNSSEHWGPSSPVQNFYNLDAERSLSTQDISQTFVTSFVAPLPFGRGHAVFGGAHGVAQALVGGWQMNTIVTLQTGSPVAVTCQQNTTNSQGGGCRPNSTGNSSQLDGRIADRLNRYFETTQFTQPANYTYGNLSRTLPDVRAPGLRNIDFSLFKSFSLTERVRLQYRAEAFNLTNSPLFGPPNGAFGGPSFGVIANQVNAPRQIQMALRLDF